MWYLASSQVNEIAACQFELKNGTTHASLGTAALVAAALQTILSSFWRARETLSASPKGLRFTSSRFGVPVPYHSGTPRTPLYLPTMVGFHSGSKWASKLEDVEWSHCGMERKFGNGRLRRNTYLRADMTSPRRDQGSASRSRPNWGPLHHSVILSNDVADCWILSSRYLGVLMLGHCLNSLTLARSFSDHAS